MKRYIILRVGKAVLTIWAETEDCHCQSFGDGSAAFIV